MSSTNVPLHLCNSSDNHCKPVSNSNDNLDYQPASRSAAVSRVLFFGRWRPERPGGAEQPVHNLAREFAKNGVSTAVWSMDSRYSKITTREVEPGIELTELPRLPRWMPWLPIRTAEFIRRESKNFDHALFFSVFIP